MRNDNRNRTTLAALTLMAALTAAPVLAAGGNGRVHEIKDGVYSFTLGQGNYSMFVVGKDGVAVFDTFNSQHSAAMLAAIRGVTEKPVKYAFHSHNHWDHASGGRPIRAGIRRLRTRSGRASGTTSRWATSPSSCATWA